MSMKRRRGLYPYESTPEEMEFYRAISGGPKTILSNAPEKPPQQKSQPPEQEEDEPQS